MPRIVKDYTKRQRTPVNIVPANPAADEQRMGGGAGGGSGASQGNREAIIAHEKAVHDRAKRSHVPNQRLRAK